MLKDNKIKVRIEDLKKETYQRNKTTIDEVLSIASDMARFDISEAFEDDGSLKPVKDMPKALRMAISGIDINELTSGGIKIGEVKKVKFTDRSKSIDMFMKHFGGVCTTGT